MTCACNTSLRQASVRVGDSCSLAQLRSPLGYTQLSQAVRRFKVKKGAGAAFEKRWCTRKSKLAVLPGFRFFTLMRRVDQAEDSGALAVWATVEMRL